MQEPEKISERIAELRRFQEKYGYNTGTVMFLMGYSYERVQELGGCDEE